jgi:hypothetical protein
MRNEKLAMSNVVVSGLSGGNAVSGRYGKRRVFRFGDEPRHKLIQILFQECFEKRRYQGTTPYQTGQNSSTDSFQGRNQKDLIP